MPSLVRRLLVSCATLAACLVGSELVARALYEAPWYERLVDEQARNQELDYRRNRFDLRGPGYPYAKEPGTFRILALGDSFTFGMGVQEEERIFVRILERELPQRLEGSAVEGVEIFNGAVIGSLTGFWVDIWRLLRREGFDPDLILIVFFLRDGTKAGSIPEFFDQIRDQVAERNRGSAIYQHSFLYRFYQDARDREAIRTNYTDRFRRGYFGDGEETAEWRNAQQNILRIRDEAAELSIETALVIFPMLAELESREYPFQDIVDLLKGFGETAGIPVHDLLPSFRGHNAPDLWVSALDQHPNEKAHAIAAESLLPFVAGLIERRAP